jgi:hypothetical protein
MNCSIFTLDAGSQRDGSSLPVASNAYLGLTSSRNTAVVATALFIQPSSPHNPQDEQASDYEQGKQGNCVEGHIESFALTAARLTLTTSGTLPLAYMLPAMDADTSSRFDLRIRVNPLAEFRKARRRTKPIHMRRAKLMLPGMGPLARVIWGIAMSERQHKAP